MRNPKFKNEFDQFIASNEEFPPPAISERILVEVRKDLNPSPFVVFSKLVAIHSLTALVTLSVCPQFGFRILGDGMGLMRIFMSLGRYGCLIACGAFFTGSSLLLAATLLKVEEVRVLRKYRVTELGSLALLSLGFFIMRDAELFLGLTFSWLFGAWIGSLISLEIGWSLRRRAHA